jgi:hypothetical protein
MVRMDGVVVDDGGTEEPILEQASTEKKLVELDVVEELLALYHVR